MSSSQITQGLEGQVTPNRLDFLWQKYRNFVYAALAAIAAGILIVYFVEQAARAQADQRWSKVSAQLGLSAGYTENGQLWSFVESQSGQQAGQYLGWYLGSTRSELLSDFPEDLEKLSVAELESAAKASDSVVGPLIYFALARRQLAAEEFDAAIATLAKIEKDYPKHFLNAETAYPVQHRPEVKKDDEEETPPKPGEEPELEPAVRGSEVARLRERVNAEMAFRTEQAKFYTAPEPTSESTAVLEFEGYEGVVKIKFYDQLAPGHVARFKELAEAGFWNGLRVHKLVRAGEQAMADDRGEVYFGLSASKEDDRTKWNDKAKAAEENIVDWEKTGVSHFPGMLAAEAADDGKSQVEKLVITTKDMAGTQDGSRVVFGRVVEGMDVLDEIVNEPFAQESEREQGQGRPEGNITVKSLRVE